MHPREVKLPSKSSAHPRVGRPDTLPCDPRDKVPRSRAGARMKLKNTIEIAVMLGSALLEVGGDAMIRRGLRGGGLALVVLGFVTLGSYGLLLTSLEVDFGKLLGAYVGVFAFVSLLWGHLVFRERVSVQTWVGLGVMLLGSLILQFASSEPS